MSPRIAYWTSAFETEMEAVASEVGLLRRNFRSSVSWGLSHHHWAMMSRRRGFCVHPKLHLLFRAATRVFQPLFQINHIFGSVGDWFYLNGSKGRPTVLTAAAQAAPVSSELLGQVDRFVVEHPGGRDELVRLGVDGSRVRLVFPPVDLERFRPIAATNEKFTVLFASSPDDEAWLEPRGVVALLDAATHCPDMHFRLLWRPWGNSQGRVEQLIRDRDLTNVEICVGRVEDMSREYQRCDVTVAPFVDMNHCKPAPNSLLESLACGRPVLCSPQVGVAEMIERQKCGVVTDPSGVEIADGLRRIQREQVEMARKAREVAEQHFDERSFISSYDTIYRELLAA